MIFPEVITYKNGVNVLLFKQCTVEGYTNYMSLDVAINRNLEKNKGLVTENLTNALADFKNQGFSGIVVFERGRSNNQLVSAHAINILEHYVIDGVCRVEINNGKRVFIFE